MYCLMKDFSLRSDKRNGPTNADKVVMGKFVCAISNHFRASSPHTVGGSSNTTCAKSCISRYRAITNAKFSSSMYLPVVYRRGQNHIIKNLPYAWPNVLLSSLRSDSMSMVRWFTRGLSLKILQPISSPAMVLWMVCNCSFPVVSPSVATRSARVGSFKAPIAELVASSSRCKPVVRTRLRGESENVESFCARAYANSFLANNVECPSPRFKKVRALRQRRYDRRNWRMKSNQHARRLSLAGQWPGKTDVLPTSKCAGTYR